MWREHRGSPSPRFSSGPTKLLPLVDMACASEKPCFFFVGLDGGEAEAGAASALSAASSAGSADSPLSVMVAIAAIAATTATPLDIELASNRSD